jgi:hypothetical protein
VLNSLEEVKKLVESGYALQALYDLIVLNDLSPSNSSTMQNVVNQLEIHENEVRRLRQNLSLRLRQQFFEEYKEGLKKRYERIR